VSKARSGLIPLAALVLAACSGGDSPSGGGRAEGPCPSRLVLQTDWWPQLEHGGMYRLLGDEIDVDAENFRVSGAVDPRYAVGGVETVEIRAGGDAISRTPVATEMTLRSEITIGYLNSSDAMKNSGKTPVVGVAKTLEVNPQSLYWDPEQTAIAGPDDLSASGRRVLHFQNTAWSLWLLQTGRMSASQSDGSYGGSPDEWIAEEGAIVQQGFATNEIWKYENLYEWKDGRPAPVEFALLHEWGFRDYPQMAVVLRDRLEELSPCLELLVPELARAWVDYLADPLPVVDRITSFNEAYDTYWKTPRQLNEAGLAIIEQRKMAVDSADGTYCSFDPDRIAYMAELLTPVFDELGVETSGDLTSVVTNEFCAGAPGRGN